MQNLAARLASAFNALVGRLGGIFDAHRAEPGLPDEPTESEQAQPAMTEMGWLMCADPKMMLGFLSGPETERKTRLFCYACCRFVWKRLDRGGRRAVETGERYVEGWASQGERNEAANEIIYTPGLPDFNTKCDLLWEIYGNPFRPVSIDPAWRTPTVTALAQAAYDNRLLPAGHLEIDRLGVLADALEDAGCDSPEVLSHLRGPGPHVRGCWAVDLLLDKG